MKSFFNRISSCSSCSENNLSGGSQATTVSPKAVAQTVSLRCPGAGPLATTAQTDSLRGRAEARELFSSVVVQHSFINAV